MKHNRIFKLSIACTALFLLCCLTMACTKKNDAGENPLRNASLATETPSPTVQPSATDKNSVRSASEIETATYAFQIYSNYLTETGGMPSPGTRFFIQSTDGYSEYIYQSSGLNFSKSYEQIPDPAALSTDSMTFALVENIPDLPKNVVIFAATPILEK